MGKDFLIDYQKPSLEDLKRAVSVLKREGVVALPTETFYGLAADPFSKTALLKIFTLKRRSLDKPLLLLIGQKEMLYELVKEIPSWGEKIIEHFWPGPLTIIFKAKEYLSELITAGTNTVAVRLSSHSIPTLLSQSFGKPITGTSANISGKPPATTAQEVREIFPYIDLILDGGPCPGEAPSTIISMVSYPPTLIREGKISWEDIISVLK